MTNCIKVILFLSVLSVTFSACSTSEQATTTADSTSLYPDWYSTSEFASDSIAFYGFGTAISSDSVVAIANAELQARYNLESAIAHKMEEVRSSLEEQGNTVATNSDFILTLRNAHQQVQKAAAMTSGEARTKKDYYTGYAQVTISKSEFRELLESGFKGKSDYWQAIRSSGAFVEEMQ